MSYEPSWDHEYEQDQRDYQDNQRQIQDNQEEQWWSHQNEKIQTAEEFWNNLRESVSKVIR